MKIPKKGTPIRTSAFENTWMPVKQPRQIGLLAGIATVSFKKGFPMTDEDLLNASNASKDADIGRPGEIKEI